MNVCTHFIFNKCPINTHDGASTKLALVETKRNTVRTVLLNTVQRITATCKKVAYTKESAILTWQQIFYIVNSRKK